MREVAFDESVERHGVLMNPWATLCAVGNSSCIKMHATKNADRCSLIGIVFERYYRIICVLFFVKRLFLTLLEYLKFHQMHQVIVVYF